MRIFARALAVVLAALVLALGPVAAQEIEYMFICPGDTDHIVGALQGMLGISEWDRTAIEAIFGDETLEALLEYQRSQNLEETGVFDAATLIKLLEIPADAAGTDELVWIPMHTGKKLHREAECSSMDGPRQVPEACAEALGFTRCKRCKWTD